MNEPTETNQQPEPSGQSVNGDSTVVRAWPADDGIFEDDVRRGVIRFQAMVPDGKGEQRGVLSVTAQLDDERVGILAKPLVFGADKRRYAVIFDLPDGATDPVFELIKTSAPVKILDREIITADATVLYSSPTEYQVMPTIFAPCWTQDGNRIAVTWLGGTYTATMPLGFDLRDVPAERVELANELLFGEIERFVFGRSRRLREVRRASSPEEFELGDPSKVLLCYSAGEDSTAALELLPSDRTISYYNERSFETYVTPTGGHIKLHATYEKSAVDRVPGLVRILNDFELIGISVGMSLGYRDSFGYAAIAALLSDYLSCNVIAFGSVMEQIFMKSGYNYSDVVNYRPAALVAYRSMFREAGLYFSVPTGALSEILTHQVTKTNRHGYVAVPCPKTNPEGQPCGTCFKCFRKIRLDEGANAPDPSEAALKSIMMRPMKSATSVVAAAQIAGETRFGLDEYANVDISFLRRYNGEGLRGLVPHDLLADLEAALEDRGIKPMTLEDEFRLRTVANIFYPDGFSMGHSFPGAQAERFSSYLAGFN